MKKKTQQDEWTFVFNEEQNISTDQSTSGMFINEKKTCLNIRKKTKNEISSNISNNNDKKPFS